MLTPQEAAVERLVSAAVAQGLPRQVSDPSALAAVAGVLGAERAITPPRRARGRAKGGDGRRRAGEASG